ncbi:MAG: DUF4326 domain-containing protein [bacterium]
MPDVVNIRTATCDVYIGRAVPRRGLPRSPYANPFEIAPNRTRDEAIALYRAWLGERPALIAQARVELAGKVLGCWCKPKACHGDVLVELINEPGDSPILGDSPPA